MFTSLSPGTELVDGQYTLKTKLGQGGMASIWSARINSTNEEVVLKILQDSLQQDEEQLAMFLEEAELSRQLHHPYIVKIRNIEHWQNLNLILMERVWGKPLNALIQQANKAGQFIPWPIATKLTCMICEALYYANVTATSEDGEALNLVHRDIKPANLLLTTQGTIKMIDFGIAKASISQVQTRTGLVKGTVAYMSPEQLHAKKLDVRSDLYSLGVVLYQLCSGERPFVAESVTALILKILSDPPPPLQQKAPHLPSSLVQIIESLLHKDKQQRPFSPMTLRIKLEAVLREHQATVQPSELKRYVCNQFPDLVKESGDNSSNQPASTASNTTIQWSQTKKDTTGSSETLSAFHSGSEDLGDTPEELPASRPSLNSAVDTLNTTNAITEAKAKGQRVAQTLPEDQIPQFFKIDESLSNRSLAKTVSDFAEDDPANWLSEEYIAAWKREAESKAYDPPSSDESQEQERITIRERVQSAHSSLGKTNQALQGKAETSAQLPRSKQTLLPIWIALIFLGMAILLLLFQK